MSDVQQSKSYEAKPESYYGNARWDYVKAMPPNGAAKILELGCGDGATGHAAIEHGVCGEYVGVEMFEPMAKRARDVLTRVHVGNIETMDLPYEPETFDAFIASEVLEHLVDPEAVLHRLVPLVKKGGLVFASSPNISWYGNLRALARGRFDYEDTGMMDRTHLRWFTPASFRGMFEKAGVEVDRIAPLWEVQGKAAVLRKLLGRRFDHLFWFQINLHGHRT